MSNPHPKIKIPGRRPYKLTTIEKEQRSRAVKAQWEKRKCAQKRLRDDLRAQ